MKEELIKLIERIFMKLTSARFIITIAFSLVYCQLVYVCSKAYISGLASNPEKLEAFATGLLTGFSGVVILIIKSYFDRTDRGGEK